MYFTIWLNTLSGLLMPSDHLSATFAALADPTRRAILARLASGETSVTELAAPFEMTAPAVTKHLKVLERAGLITRSRHAQWRPCQLNAAPLHQAADFIEQYRQFWEQSFDRLEAYLKTMQDQPTPQKPQSLKQKEKKNGRNKR
jgi:DNA-binding transcriptional ArsR family regulator